jgi:hypothetical protein
MTPYSLAPVVTVVPVAAGGADDEVVGAGVLEDVVVVDADGCRSADSSTAAFPLHPVRVRARAQAMAAARRRRRESWAVTPSSSRAGPLCCQCPRP